MITYNFVIGVYVKDTDVEKLRNFCEEHRLEFEDDLSCYYESPVWQEDYRKLTGLSGKIKHCYVSAKTVIRTETLKIFDDIEKAGIDMFINIGLT